MKNCKKTFLLFSLVSCFIGLDAQTLVIDPAMITALTITHNEQQATLNGIKSKQTEVRNYDVLITAKLTQLKDLQQKTYSYLSTVNAVVQNGKDIVYASEIAKDIAKYQAQAARNAANDPQLLLVCTKTEYELVSRTADLFLYIYNIALKSGAGNLMDNKARIDLCIHVVKELQSMRTLAYSVCRRIKTAQRSGVLKQLIPGQFRYVNTSTQKVNKILGDLKYISKGGKY